VKHVYANGELVATVDYNGSTTTVYHDHTDHLTGTGTITSSTPTEIQTLDYLAFGEQRINDKAGAFDEQVGYIGQVYDESTQMSYLNARYYQGSRGQFISQDPVFRNPNGFGADFYTSFLNDPQTQNSYSYARNNPINRSDPSGLFNSKTGAVEKGDTLSKITNILNTNNGTNYSVPQVAKLNGIKDANKINIGQTLVPNEKIPDITSSLTSLMEKNSSDWKINNPLYFRSQVKNNGPWDLKNNSEYSSKTYTDGFVFNAEKIRSDSPANIHYGYVGNAAFWGVPSILLQEAGSAQIRAGTSQPEWRNGFYGDDPRDQSDIMRGINLYRNR